MPEGEVVQLSLDCLAAKDVTGDSHLSMGYIKNSQQTWPSIGGTDLSIYFLLQNRFRNPQTSGK